MPTSTTYRSPGTTPKDDRREIAALCERLHVRVLLVMASVSALFVLFALFVGWISHGRFLFFFLPFLFLGRRARRAASIGLMLPDVHRYHVFTGPDAFDVEVDRLRARIPWDDVVHVKDRTDASDSLRVLGIVGSLGLELRTGEKIGIPSGAEGIARLKLELRRRFASRRGGAELGYGPPPDSAS